MILLITGDNPISSDFLREIVQKTVQARSGPGFYNEQDKDGGFLQSRFHFLNN
jgi:hypothetical protein